MRILTTLLCLAWATGALAYSSSPPNAVTGAPGEGSCTNCHSTFPVNSGAGSLSVSGVPNAWVPLSEYDLTVTLADGDASRWGFEFTVLDPGGDSVGTLSLLDANAQLGTQGTRTYAKQTSAGTQTGATGSVSWNVRWTAPATGAGDATFYAAGNAANGNSSTSGDRIYTTSVTWVEDDLSAAGTPSAADVQLSAAYPNPFNPLTNITYELGRGMDVRLVVYGLDGSLVRVLESGYRDEGLHAATWNGLDSAGRAMPSGVYLYRLKAGDTVQLRRMTLVR